MAKSVSKKKVSSKKVTSKKVTSKKVTSKKTTKKKPTSKKTTKKATKKVVEKKVVEKKVKKARKSGIEDILFKVPHVENPFIGTPKEVQGELDALALSIKANPESIDSQKGFNRIHVFMQGYLINVALKQFPYIKGLQTSDIYQNALIALRFKAIPGFETGKNMSFLNFAKMCIRRHLITLLNASHYRQKSLSMNLAVSLDSVSPNSDDDSKNTLANIIPDGGIPVDKATEQNESYQVTKDSLLDVLSSFERIVLKEHLEGASYKEIAINIAPILGEDYVKPKSVDNALFRIRKKASQLKKTGKVEEMPLFIV